MENNKKVQNGQNKKKKKKILLGCLFGVLGAGAVATAIAVPLSLSHKSDDPIPSKHGFTVENKDYKVSGTNTVTLTIKCDNQEEHTHTLKEIVLMLRNNEVSDVIPSASMVNGTVNVTFTNVNLTEEKNKVSVQFKVDEATEFEEIKNVTIKGLKTINLTDDDFDGSGSWIRLKNGRDLPNGTRVNVTFNTNKFQPEPTEASTCAIMMYRSSGESGLEGIDITSKTDLNSISFDEETVELELDQYAEGVPILKCGWKSSYYNKDATFSFNVKEDCGQAFIAFGLD